MDQAFIPPRSSSTSSFSPNPGRTQRLGTNHPRGFPATTTDPAQQGIRRGNSDSAAVTANDLRLAFGEHSGIGDATWREFLRSSGNDARGGRDTNIDPTAPTTTTATRGIGSTASVHPGTSADASSSIPSYHTVANAISASRKRYAPGPEAAGASTHKRSYPGMRPTTPPRRNERSGDTAASAIDLMSPSPPALRPTAFSDSNASPTQTQRMPSSRSVQLPPWQSDNDALHCPVCKTAFGFWNRKHHCRKCGKVVCDGCSRHRITIPRQYIVQPPPGAANSSFSSTFSALGVSPPSRSLDAPFGFAQTPSNDNASSPGFPSSTAPAVGGGAEVVRVCNPCVPDPNLSPPPQTPVATPSSPPPFYTTFGMPPSHPAGRPQPLLAARPPPIPERRGSGLQGFGSSSSNARPFGLGNDPPFGNGLALPRGPTGLYQGQGIPYPPQFLPGRRATLGSSMHRPINAHYSNERPLAGMLAPISGMHRPYSATSLPTQPPHQTHGSSHHLRFPPQQPPPRREIPEEDECPVCGRELPPKGADGDTKAREKHVEDCISLHSFSTSTPSSSMAAAVAVPDAFVQSLSRTATTNIPSSAATIIATPASSQTLSFRTGAPPTSHPALQGAWSASAPSSSFSSAPSAQAQAQAQAQAPQRGNRMILYRASEKDCVGEDGEAQECVICFEEFEPGDEMGRLECWCKFHRLCIRRWWETKGPGSCPTHQLHH